MATRILKQIIFTLSFYVSSLSSMPTTATDISQFIIPNDTRVVPLECESAFNGLTDEEALYAHYISQATWYGGLICLYQTSPESPGVFLLLQKVFRSRPVSELCATAEANGVTKEEIQALLIYAAGFYANMGNYKYFVDSKFIPNLPKEKFETVIMNSAATVNDRASVKALWDSVSDRLYSLTDKNKRLGFGQKGTTTYYSSNIDREDVEITQRFLDVKGISPYNTRLFKTTKGGETLYEVRLASAETTNLNGGGDKDSIMGLHRFESSTFNVTKGDYDRLMELVVENLGKAKEHTVNDLERSMLTEFVKSFKTGSIQHHKNGSRYWIKNKGPKVETYIGFTESDRDPFGVRGEFEGFVAVLNKEMSAKYSDLVQKVEQLLPLLPWSAVFEKDIFLKPDFTSLDALAFGGAGIPTRISIPNYDDIRQDEGFKSFFLENALTSGYNDTKVSFLSDQDKDLYLKLKTRSDEVQVGLREILGRGSGKLFKEDENETLNFDLDSVQHPETNEKITKWYMKNETWESKFTTIASSYEECRVECVGIYLCLSTDALKSFGHTGDSADDIIYINWLNMARAGLLALEFYSPDTGDWRQAQMQARFCILRVMLEAGHDLVKIEKTTGEDGNEDILLTLDRSKIITTGKAAIGLFLQKLQVYKSTADVKSGKNLYDFYSDVNDHDEPDFLSLRSVVLARKQPMKMFVQHNTVVDGNRITLKKYDSSPEGLVQSFVDRFPSTDIDNILRELWDRDKPFFQE